MNAAVHTVRVCATGDVAVGTAGRFDVEGHRLCVVHLDGTGGEEWYVIGDRCSHADYSLAEGDVWVDEREIECPKHGSTFSLVTGAPLTLPATQPVPIYEVAVVDDDVMVTMTEQPSGRESGAPASSERDQKPEPT
jgi:3-phenylpropionate/trans-cinnamate dioxygenase ferredoxin subunit